MKGERITKHPEAGSTSKKVECVLVISGDWEGLYINGRLVNQNHELTAADVLGELAVYGINFNKVFCDEKWLGVKGSLPPKFSEVKLKK